MDLVGNHIAALLLRMFVMYYPQMIEAGMVYKAIPPLYAIKQGKKNKYFTENVDMVKYIQKAFTEKYNMTNLKKKPLTSKEMTIFFMRNADYNYYLEDAASTYAVNPSLLEVILYHYVMNKNKFSLEKLKKDLANSFRFVSAKKVKDTIIVDGTIDEKYTLFLSDKIIYDCRHVIDILKSNDELFYKINNIKMTLYQIMQLYEKSTPAHVQRYKGLGEMDYDELAESTLLPNGRTLIRYTLESAKEEIETIRQYESDPKKILGLVGNVTREDLLD